MENNNTNIHWGIVRSLKMVNYSLPISKWELCLIKYLWNNWSSLEFSHVKNLHVNQWKTLPSLRPFYCAVVLRSRLRSCIVTSFKNCRVRAHIYLSSFTPPPQTAGQMCKSEDFKNIHSFTRIRKSGVPIKRHNKCHQIFRGLFTRDVSDGDARCVSVTRQTVRN